MTIQYKSVAVGGVSAIEDEGDGVVTAFVSVTGVEDNVKDIIEPGAYEKTLETRKPKGVWGHQWLKPISKTLAAEELPPGSPDLPKELSNGQPWPEEAGALKIKMKFNMKTERGRDAYQDVVFFGNEQEWSIGYSVPSDGFYKDANGVRHIKRLELFEYSPVLFGAMSHARTAADATSVKEAQFAVKAMGGVTILELKSWDDRLTEFKEEHTLIEPDVIDGDDPEDFVGDELIESDDDGSEDEDLLSDEDEDDQIKALADGMTPIELRNAISTFEKVLSVLPGGDDSQELKVLGDKALIEAKATVYDTVTAAVEAIDVELDDADVKSLQDAAVALDDALEADDLKAAEEAAVEMLDTLDGAMDTVDGDDTSLRTIARVIADKMAPTDEDEYEGDEEEEDEEDDDEKPSFWGSGKKPKGSRKYVDASGVEYKNVSYSNRTFGMPSGPVELKSRDKVRAFIGCLDNVTLGALSSVVEGTRGNVLVKSAVRSEIESRVYTGEWKAGQAGRGGGFHRMAAEGRTPDTGRAKKKPTRPGFTSGAVRGRVQPSIYEEGMDRASKRATKVPNEPARVAVQAKTRMEDDSFPIGNTIDLKKAIQAFGRATDKEAAKEYIMACAKQLGRSDMIPDDWKTVTIDTVELKSMESFLADLPDVTS